MPANKGTLQSSKIALTRGRIMDAALEALATMPYTELTAEIVARGAGCSRATFYLHYPSRAGVMVAILERLEEEMHEASGAVMVSMAARPGSAELIEQWREQLTFGGRYPGLLGALGVARQIDPEVAEWHERYLAKELEPIFEARRNEGASDAAIERLKSRVYALVRMSASAFPISSADLSEAEHARVVEVLAELWSFILA